MSLILVLVEHNINFIIENSLIQQAVACFKLDFVIDHSKEIAITIMNSVEKH